MNKNITTIFFYINYILALMRCHNELCAYLFHNTEEWYKCYHYTAYTFTERWKVQQIFFQMDNDLPEDEIICYDE